MFKINYGYGCSNKSYNTLKGAKIACAAFFKKNSTCHWLDVVEIKNVMRDAGTYKYLSTEVIHHTIVRK